MKALIYKNNNIEFIEKPIPQIQSPRDAIVKVKLSSICTSDLHIIKGFVPQAKEGIVLGHEFVGEVVEIGSKVNNIKIGTRVVANCETFCGECYFCKRGYINNCVNGGWELGCKIDGCQAEYVRVPYADTGLTKIPNNVSYRNALFVGDILSSGYFGFELCDAKENDTIAVIGSGPVGLCAMICAKAIGNCNIIAIDIDNKRLELAKNLKIADYVLNPNVTDVEQEIFKITQNRGADGVIEAAGGDSTFEMAWKIARPNSVVAIVAMYEENQILPLPQMYGKNIIFKTGGVNAIHINKLLNLISNNVISTDFLISKTFNFKNIENAYKYFDKKSDNCLKIAIAHN